MNYGFFKELLSYSIKESYFTIHSNDQQRYYKMNAVW
jgi:hypothetical protein